MSHDQLLIKQNKFIHHQMLKANQRCLNTLGGAKNTNGIIGMDGMVNLLILHGISGVHSVKTCE